jgi:hypothetical protein
VYAFKVSEVQQLKCTYEDVQQLFGDGEYVLFMLDYVRYVIPHFKTPYTPPHTHTHKHTHTHAHAHTAKSIADKLSQDLNQLQWYQERLEYSGEGVCMSVCMVHVRI